MRRFGIIGFPLSHSFSQKYFTDKFAREGIGDCVYEQFPIRSVEELPSILQHYPDLRGLNVTIPYKQAVVPYLHQSCLPEGMNACNCIRIDDGRLTGFNTDIAGFEKSFAPFLEKHHTQALVLGNGGAAEAVIYVLKRLGIGYQIVSRQSHGGSTLSYEQLDENIMAAHALIINTTPLGTFPDTERSAPIPYEFVTPNHYLFDLVYNPSKTLFLKKGEERGARIKNGLDMLGIQAEEGWKIWNANPST